MPDPFVAAYISYINCAPYPRKDALVYRTNNSVSYSNIEVEYPEEFFNSTSNKSKSAQMYDAGGSYYDFIESTRHNTVNGMIQGEVIDSVWTYSEEMFLRQMLEYCKFADIEVVSKAEAYDICFNHVKEDGNLIYNADLRNTAKEFMPDAENVPENPDGYIGNCRVEFDGNNNPVLVVEGETYYYHYGVPLGDIRFAADMMGKGTVMIYGIKNSDSIDADNSELELLGMVEIDNKNFDETNIDFIVPDNQLEEYNQICEEYGDKIMGIKILYYGNISVQNLQLIKK